MEITMKELKERLIELGASSEVAKRLAAEYFQQISPRKDVLNENHKN